MGGRVDSNIDAHGFTFLLALLRHVLDPFQPPKQFRFILFQGLKLAL